MDSEHERDSSNGNHHAYHQSDEWTFEDLLIVLRRGRWTIAISTIVVLLAVGLYTYLTKPIYESSASVLIDSKSKAGSFPVFDLSGSGLTTKITNELETLRSRSLAEAVAQSLKDKKYLDEEQQRPIQIIHNLEAGLRSDACFIDPGHCQTLERKRLSSRPSKNPTSSRSPSGATIPTKRRSSPTPTPRPTPTAT